MEESQGIQSHFCGMCLLQCNLRFVASNNAVSQAVYQSILQLGWIDKLLDNIATLYIDLYKDQLRSTRARIVQYPFDKYFDQQVRELEGSSGFVASESSVANAVDKKDPLVSSDNGGPPPPSVSGLIKGMFYCVPPISGPY